MLQDETIVTFSEAARALPKVNGRRPHASTLWRWARNGLLGIRLETRRLGGRFVTSLQAVERFTQALAEAEVQRPRSTAGPVKPPKSPTEPQRQKNLQRAERELDAAGI